MVCPMAWRAALVWPVRAPRAVPGDRGAHRCRPPAAGACSGL